MISALWERGGGEGNLVVAPKSGYTDTEYNFAVAF